MLDFLCCRGGTLVGESEYREPIPGLLQTLPMSFSRIDPAVYLVLLCSGNKYEPRGQLYTESVSLSSELLYMWMVLGIPRQLLYILCAHML